MAFIAGGGLHPWTWLLTGLALGLSHLGSLWINWYDGGERLRVSPGSAMWQPYPRMLVLHVGILVGFGLVMRSVGSADTAERPRAAGTRAGAAGAQDGRRPRAAPVGAVAGGLAAAGAGRVTSPTTGRQGEYLPGGRSCAQ